MSEQKPKIILAVLLGIVSVSLLATASYNFFPSQEDANPTAKPIMPTVLISSINSSNIAQGESITISLTLTLKSNETEVIVPLYLGSAYENQSFSGYTVIATPPPPYSSELPWEQINTSTEPKPFTATFDPNPAILKSNEAKTINLTIQVAENAALGAYNMDVAISDYPQTFKVATGFQLTVLSKNNPAVGDFWVERAPMPDSHIFLEAVTMEGKIFVIGSNYTVTSNSNYMYDPLIDTWISKTPMNLYRGNFAVATVQGKIYVMGGFIGTSPQFVPTATAANEMYDPATDTWANKTSLPAAEGFLQAVTVNGKIYVMGGAAYNGKDYDINGTNEVYDPVSASWQSLAPMPTPVFNFAMTAVGSKIYVMGGQLNGPTYHSNQTQIYDTQTNTWTFGQPMPITTFSAAAVATSGVLAPVRIYYIGGTDETTWAHTNTGPCPTQIYDPQTDSWSLGTSVPTPRASGFTLAVVNDTIYAIGGYDGVSESVVNEQYFPLDYTGPMPSQTNNPTAVSPNGNPEVPNEQDDTTIPSEEPFPITFVAAICGVSVAIIGIGLFLYFNKRGRSRNP